jgi:Plasmid pRiA4b ORF-3-like protein
MSEPSVSSIAIYQLRVVLCGVSPLVWRRLLVVSTTSIAELHEILQSTFGWSGEHLHRFLIHGAAYGIPHLGGIVFREDARGVALSRFRLHCGERFGVPIAGGQLWNPFHNCPPAIATPDHALQLDDRGHLTRGPVGAPQRRRSSGADTAVSRTH